MEKQQGLLKNVVDILNQQGVSASDAQLIQKELEKEMAQEPDPKIAFIGFTGVGKSSTLNELFNAGQPISDVRACTQDAKEIYGDYTQYTGSKGSIIVYDMPGLGEDIVSDQRHIETYKQILPKVDVIVWTFHADDRAMTPMQQAILALQQSIGNDFINKLVFAINKADAIPPGESDWNVDSNMPSLQQLQNIKEFELYVASKICQVIPNWRGSIISYSAKRRYRLEQLISAMIEASNTRRRWVLNNRADVSDPMEYMNSFVREFIEQQIAERQVR